jgi:hypothetical protein
MSVENLTQHVAQVTLQNTNFNTISPLSDLEVQEFLPDNPEDKAESDDFSIYSTPSGPGRIGTSFTTAKKYLGSWLRAINAFHCSITLTPIGKTRVIHIAHVLLPQCATADAVGCLCSFVSVSDCFVDQFDWPHSRNEES